MTDPMPTKRRHKRGLSLTHEMQARSLTMDLPMATGFYWIRKPRAGRGAIQWTVAEVYDRTNILTFYRTQKYVRWLGSGDEAGLQKTLALGWVFGPKLDPPGPG